MNPPDTPRTNNGRIDFDALSPKQIEDVVDIGLRHRTGKKPTDYLKQWLFIGRHFGFATHDDSWGEFEKEFAIIIKRLVVAERGARPQPVTEGLREALQSIHNLAGVHADTDDKQAAGELKLIYDTATKALAAAPTTPPAPSFTAAIQKRRETYEAKLQNETGTAETDACLRFALEVLRGVEFDAAHSPVNTAQPAGSELLHCGCTAMPIVKSNRFHHWIECENCGRRQEYSTRVGTDKTREEAIRLWNEEHNTGTQPVTTGPSAEPEIDPNAPEPFGPKGCGKLSIKGAQQHNRRQAAKMVEGRLYRLYDHYRSAFWGPNEAGYQYRVGAGLYTPEHAKRIIVGTESGEQERYFTVEDAGAALAPGADKGGA